MKRLIGILASGALSTTSTAQLGEHPQIDIKARVRGESQWRDVVDVSVGTNDVLELEFGVFLYRKYGFEMARCTCSLMVSGWNGVDQASLLDRADSPIHPDGRQGPFNFGGQAQHAYTTGLDAGRLRIAASNNPGDVPAGGVNMTRASSSMSDFPLEGLLGFRFDITLVNPRPGNPGVQSLVADAPLDRVTSYAVFESRSSISSTSIRDLLVATDVASIRVRWTKCPSGCDADFDCDGFATGDDFDGFVAAFVFGSGDADFDGNGFVNGDDFDGYVSAFVAGC